MDYVVIVQDCWHLGDTNLNLICGGVAKLEH